MGKINYKEGVKWFETMLAVRGIKVEYPRPVGSGWQWTIKQPDKDPTWHVDDTEKASWESLYKQLDSLYRLP